MYLLLFVCLLVSLSEAAPRRTIREGGFCKAVYITTTMDRTTMTSMDGWRASTTAVPTEGEKSLYSYDHAVWTGILTEGASTTMIPPASSTWMVTSTSTARPTAEPSSTKRRNVLYFTNWSIYNNFTLKNVPIQHVTHLLYSFASIAANASAILTDLNTDTQHQLDPIQQRDAKDIVHGNIEQLFQLKKKHRSLKTLLSIGGASLSNNGIFKAPSNSSAGRRAFADSVVKLVSEYGFDGVDIDWEYPQTSEADDFAAMIKQTRNALDRYARRNRQNYHYQLTIAVSSNPRNYAALNLKELDRHVDAWHLMAYDYSGSFSRVASHQAGVYADAADPDSTETTTNAAVQGYLTGGVPLDKIVLGIPLYGRVFQDTDGLGGSFDNFKTNRLESTSASDYLYNELPKGEEKVHVDKEVMAAWTYNTTSRELVSFDNPETTRLKARYVQDQGLAGAMFWEASGDKPGNDSLVKIMSENMGQLDDSPNMLDYPESPWSNIGY